MIIKLNFNKITFLLLPLILSAATIPPVSRQIQQSCSMTHGTVTVAAFSQVSVLKRQLQRLDISLCQRNYRKPEDAALLVQLV